MTTPHSQGAAPVQATWKRRLGNGAMIVAIFAVLGPLVGLVVFSFGAGIGLNSMSTIVGGLLFGVLFAHVMGGVQAVLSGLVVALVADRTERAVPWWVGALAGLAAGLLITEPQNMLDNAAGDNGPLTALLLVVSHAVAGGTLTWMTRRWQGVRGTASNPGR